MSAMQTEITEAVERATAPLFADIRELKTMLSRALTPDDKAYFSIDEAAKILKLKPDTLRTKCRNGSIPFEREKGGRKMLIRRDVILAK
ncbi:helix-turn-helix domain-containing protein [Falsihalocynthiibacter sp. S25ZX9]|uniref:helix-turn-helix domain-containing protein n=1 Tax=Falsihalocynthiibacter sp. S25ZX9 TaxID=3240870 RepID=UPI003510B3A7